MLARLVKNRILEHTLHAECWTLQVRVDSAYRGSSLNWPFPVVIFFLRRLPQRTRSNVEKHTNSHYIF